VEDGTVRKSVGEFLQALYSNFSSIFTRFRDIAAFVLQQATFSHATYSLPQFFLCSPGSTWMAFGLRRATVLGLVSVKFVSKISNLCGPIHERHRQTDRQTDRWKTKFSCSCCRQGSKFTHTTPILKSLHWLKINGALSIRFSISLIKFAIPLNLPIYIT